MVMIRTVGYYRVAAVRELQPPFAAQKLLICSQVGLCNPWVWGQLQKSIGMYQQYQLQHQLSLWWLLLESEE